MNYKIVAVFLLILTASIVSISISTNDNQPVVGNNDTLQSFQESRSLMDTTVTIHIKDNNKTHAKKVIDEAFSEIKSVDKMMSSYKNDSQLSKLNNNGFVKNASSDFLHVIKKSKHYYNVSNGAFDITVKPIIDLWEKKFAPGGPQKPPSEKEINKTLKLVNNSNITIENNNIFIKKDMGIVLGGVAKGFAVDETIKSLKNSGIENGFVNAGGDGRYIGYKNDNTPWKVGLRNPNKTGDAITVMNINNMAVATSGNYERYYNKSASVTHISDPRTGYPSRKIISSTVIAETAMDADAYSTAVFVLGEDNGLEMIEQLDNVECLIITSNRSIIRSSGFDEYEK
jgi:thiamine biosynthesis lipoprotein